MKSFNTELVIAGGGCGGFGAAVQAARMGVKTLLIEETPWLGGMITAAGVSAFDGNKYAVGGGIYLELRRKIEEYYGGADKTFTGWISLTCFEPSVGARFIHEIASAEENLTIWFNTKLVGVLKNGNRVTGLRVMHEGEETEINARLTVEATEFGDVLLMAGIPHRFGRDSKEESGENSAPELHDDIIQDMTFCATLKKYDGKAPVVTASPRYDENRFINSTDVHCDTTDEAYLNHKLHSWESFITYAALPNDKYLLNWPFRSNDYPTTRDIYDDHAGRSEHFRKAKELTLDYVHYMQTKLGHPEWGIATDEYPTEDNLPFIPYVREGRRGNGRYFMVENDVVPAEGSHRPPLREDGIAVGDYFLDHHHSHAFLTPDKRLIENYPDNAPFQIPLGCLVPEGTEGLILSEKNISVSHIVNGCTRLQPCVVLTGQAGGALAAIAIKKGVEAADVDHADVQDALLKSGAQVFPYKDFYPEMPGFYEVQKLALAGVYHDNEAFTFEGDEAVSEAEILEVVKNAGIENDSAKFRAGMSRLELYLAVFNQKFC